MRNPSLRKAFSHTLFLLLSAFISGDLSAQRNFFSILPGDPEVSAERRIIPDRYMNAELDVIAIEQWLATVDATPLEEAQKVIALPTPEGGHEHFVIARTPIMERDLATRFPEISTFTGRSLDRPGSTLKMDITPHGLHAMILALDGDPIYIDPFAYGDRRHYIVYRKSAFRKTLPESFSYCSYEQVNDLEEQARRSEEWIEEMGPDRAGDCQLRTYRLALACTGEYANYHGSNTTNNNKSFALAAMVTTMNRVNGIYERDATLRMIMVANNDQLIYLNGSTDPYSNGNGGTMLGQNISNCNAVIGSANYDIGHVFSTGGGGVAYLNSPCTSNKAGGVTGQPNPVGDPFDIDYVAHEMGHQYGGNHTQNNACNRSANAAYEPGSASTIMGYAGICSPNVQSNSDALFLGYSMMEMAANITVGSSSGCPVISSSNNNAPTVNAGADRTIPRSTPFVLTATASDVNAGQTLTYAWEQMNNQVSTQPPVSTSTGGPNFRALLPNASPMRYFPNLGAVLSNTTPTWEVLPSVGRTMNFKVTVRDNLTGSGCNAQDDVVITVSGTAGPFVVTQPNTNVSWEAGSVRTITWNVANTNVSPVNAANVDILLSTDGGNTYPFTLAASTANDGSQIVTLPSGVATTTARVMVKASANVFYDVSDQNFSITAPANVVVNVGMYLEGPYDPSIGMMKDDLRAAGLVPLTEPYSGLDLPQVAGGGGETTTVAVLAITGSNAIVDWVRLELRSAVNNSQIVATRQALLQRDGDVVAADGLSPISFNVGTGTYHLAVTHRNHLGCMTASPITLGASPITVNFRSGATAMYGAEARKQVGSVQTLWAGNSYRNNVLSYTGVNNDRDPVLVAIGGAVPTAIATGYLAADHNMDGVVKYTGTANDRDIILVNVGGNTPTNVRTEQVP